MGMCQRTTLSPARAEEGPGSAYSKACDPLDRGKEEENPAWRFWLSLASPVTVFLLLEAQAVPLMRSDMAREVKRCGQAVSPRPPQLSPTQLALLKPPESAPAGWKMKAGLLAPLLHLPK